MSRFRAVWELRGGVGVPGGVQFADLVEQYRLSRGLRQAQIAAYLGVSQGQVSEWKSGQRPPVRAVIRFARLVNMDYRKALQAAGHWPEDIAIEDEPALVETIPMDLVRVWRRISEEHRPVAVPDLVRVIEIWSELPPDVQQAVLAALERFVGALARQASSKS